MKKSRLGIALCFLLSVLPAWSLRDLQFVPGSLSLDETNVFKYVSQEFNGTVTNGNAPEAATTVDFALIAREATAPFDTYFIEHSATTNETDADTTTTFLSPDASTTTRPLTRYLFTETIPAGSYSVSAVIDPLNLVPDANRNNNTSFVANITVQPTMDLAYHVPAASDLIKLADGGSNLYLNTGNSFDVRIFYQNLGDLTEIPPFLVDYYLIPTTEISGSVSNGRLFTVVTVDSYFLARRTAPGLTTAQQLSPGFTGFTESFNLPSNLDSLNYHLGVVLDPEDTIPEPKPQGSVPWINRNVDFSEHLITVAYINERPDYQQGNPGLNNYSPNSIEPGESFNFTTQITNSTAFFNSSFSLLNFKLVRDQNSQFAFTLGNRLMPSIGPLDTYLFSENFVVPPGLSPGAYRIQYDIDSSDVVPERFEDNNLGGTFGTVLTVTEPTKPDLTGIGFLDPTPSVATNGGSVAFETDIKNIGFAGTPPFDVRYLLSPNRDFSDGDEITVGTNRIFTTILPGVTATVTPTLTLPPTNDLPPGDYFINVAIDVGDEADEIRDDNNEAFVPLSPQLTVNPPNPGPFPDLEPLELSSSSTPGTYGGSINLDILIANNGPINLPGFKYSVFLSPDPIAGNGDDIFLDTLIGPAINGSDEKDANFTGTLPGPGIPAGPYYLVVEVDSTEEIDESDEANNITTLLEDPFTLAPTSSGQYPELEAVRISMNEDSLPRGGQFSVIADIRNIGGTNALGVMIELVASTNAVLGDADDMVLGTVGPETLGAGVQSNLLSTLTLPVSLPPGSYVLGCTVDPDNLILENITNNNSQTIEFQIREPAIEVFIVESSSTNDLIGVLEPATGQEYQLEITSNLTSWIGVGNSQTGEVSIPLLFDSPGKGDVRIFRVDEP